MKTITLVTTAVAFLALVVIMTMMTVFVVGTKASQDQRAAADPVPAFINYQGYLTDTSGEPVDELTDLKFAIFEGSAGGSAIWSEAQDNVDIKNGYFSVQLGTNTPFSADDFVLPAGKATLYIQVSVVESGGGEVMLPRQPLASVPYAFQAASAPWGGLIGIPASFSDDLDDVAYEKVVVVAKSGAPFSSIQSAVNSIGDVNAGNRYLVWVAPGTYQEQVKLKPGIHLVGAGKRLTFIESTVSNLEDIYPPTEATLHLDDYVDVHSLTVSNYGANYHNAAILVPEGCEHNTIKDVSVVAGGVGDNNYGIFVQGGGTSIDLESVDSAAFGGVFANVGLEVVDGAAVTAQNGNFNGYNGEWANGIVGEDEGTRLNLIGVQAEGADSDHAIGLTLNDGASGIAQGGYFEGRGAFTETFGINITNGAHLEASNVGALGRDSPNWNQGLAVANSTAIVNGGVFTGQGGVETYGIIATGGSTMEATAIKAIGEDGSDRNDGLRVEGGSIAAVYGGYLHGRGGVDNRGAASYEAGSTLDLYQLTAYGENGGEAGVVGIGASNENESDAFISGSELHGDTYAQFADGATARIYLSRLTGGSIGGGGGKVCLGVTYLASFYADVCPDP